ncbi:c-type cytochrome [Marinomonas agarivorans]|nr:c-type cytochrome [Marinomonas agarivorans]
MNIKRYLVTFIACTLSVAALALEKSDFVRPDQIPFPTDNPYSVQKAALGKMLFFEPRLSRNRNMTCATCHNPSFGWEDSTKTAVGAQNTNLGRHSPTVLNAAWGDLFFWDGRASSLEEQAAGPIESNVEMNLPIEQAVSRLKEISAYQQWFADVFGAEGITANNIKKAIATFERTVVTGQAPFDDWVEGQEAALTEQEQLGFELFIGKAQCANCHTGWNFTDNMFHDIGLSGDDVGRYGITKQEKDRFAFKTPSLRNISQRAPYMHDGRFTTLQQVIVHYMSAGINRPTRSDLMEPFALTTDEISALEAFMLTLTGEDQPVTLPTLPLF